jgi:DNA-directed RNA polymerase specialized sigma24 family protein
MSQNHLRADFELMSVGNRGNQAASGELFERHYMSSTRLARVILRSGKGAEDAVKGLETGRGQNRLASRWPNPEESAWSSEIGPACSGALAKLPGDQREAFNLRAASSVTVRDVATALGLTVPAEKATRPGAVFAAQPQSADLGRPAHANQSV